MAREKTDAKPIAAETVVPPAKASGQSADFAERRCGFRFAAVLLAGLAFPAANNGCMLNSTGMGPEQTDAEQDADSENEAEIDAEAGEDVVDGDAPEIPDIVGDESSDVTDAVEDSDVDRAEMEEDSTAEDSGCVTMPVYDTVSNPLPEEVGGSRQFEEFWYRTDTYTGPECESASGDRELDRISFRLETPIADTSPEGLREVVRMGGITKGFGADVDQKIMELGSGYIVLAQIIEGAVLGPGMPIGQVSDGIRYFVIRESVGERADGTKYCRLNIVDAESMMPVGNAEINEGDTYTLPSGKRVMATTINILAGTVRVDTLEPNDRINNGEIRMREEDGMHYRFEMDLPDGWTLYPASL